MRVGATDGTNKSVKNYKQKTKRARAKVEMMFKCQ